MTTFKKVLIVLAVAFGLSVLGWGLLIGTVYAYGGIMTVSVDAAHGPSFAVPVPMAVVDAALATTDLALDEVHLKLDEWGPALVGMLAALEDCPDATLIEVEDRGDFVRISKEGGQLRVEVREPDVNVEVSIPARSARRLIARLSA